MSANRYWHAPPAPAWAVRDVLGADELLPEHAASSSGAHRSATTSLILGCILYPPCYGQFICPGRGNSPRQVRRSSPGWSGRWERSEQPTGTTGCGPPWQEPSHLARRVPAT